MMRAETRLPAILLCLCLLLGLAACGGGGPAEEAAAEETIATEEPVPTEEPAAEEPPAEEEAFPAGTGIVPLAGRYVLVSVQLEGQDLGGVIGSYLDLEDDLTGWIFLGEEFGVGRELKVSLDPEAGTLTAFEHGGNETLPCAVESEEVVDLDVGSGVILVFAREGSRRADDLSDGAFAWSARAGELFYEDDAVAVRIKGTETTAMGEVQLYLSAENKTDGDLILISDGAVVNGSAFTFAYGDLEIPAGESVTGNLFLLENELRELGVGEITSLNIVFRTVDGTGETVSLGEGIWYPLGEEAAGEPMTFDPEAAGATLLAEGGGCALYLIEAGPDAAPVLTGVFGLEIVLVNGTDRHILFGAQDILVNGQSLDWSWNRELLPHSFCKSWLTFSREDFEQLGLKPEEAEDVALVLYARGSDDTSAPECFRETVEVVPD